MLHKSQISNFVAFQILGLTKTKDFFIYLHLLVQRIVNLLVSMDQKMTSSLQQCGLENWHSNGEKKSHLAITIKETFFLSIIRLPSPIASATMMILCTSSEKNCGIWGKIAEDMDKFDLIRLQTNQMATARSLKRTSQRTTVKDSIK